MTWNYSNTAAATTLTNSATPADPTIVVASVSGLPVSYPYSLVLDYEQPTAEIVTVTSAVGNTLSVTRGEDGTAATSHTAGAAVVHAVVARDLREASQHVNATSDVHGIGAAADVAGTSTVQTLTNKTISGSANTLTDLPADQLDGPLVDAVVEPSAIGTVALTVDALVGQTANLQQWRNSAGTAVTTINKDGELVLPSNVRGSSTTIHATTNINGGLTASTVTATSITATGGVQAQSLSSSNDTTVGSDGTGNLTVNGSVTASSAVTGGTVHANGTLTSDGNATIGNDGSGNLTVNGTGSFKDGVTVGSDGSGNLTVNGTITATSSVTASSAVIGGVDVTTPTLTSGTSVMTAAAGWTITAAEAYVFLNKFVVVTGTVTRSGATITSAAGASGNIADVQIATMAAGFWPTVNAHFMIKPGAQFPALARINSSDGQVMLEAFATGSQSFTSGDAATFTLCFVKA